MSEKVARLLAAAEEVGASSERSRLGPTTPEAAEALLSPVPKY